MVVLEHEADLMQPELRQLIVPILQMSVFSTFTVPLFGRKMPEIMLSIVVLPLPDGPTTYSISPKWPRSSHL